LCPRRGFPPMEYVMVPVPDEFVVDVMQYVARLVARSALVPWTKEGIEEFFDSAEETAKSLLSLVARYTVAGKEVGYDEATETLELSQREIREIVREINADAQLKRFEPLITTQEASVLLRSGRMAQRLLFIMAEPVARMIRAHEHATLTGVERPANASEVESSVTSSE
jgi:hypothetical protein